MKSGDKVSLSVLRILNSEIKNKEIEKGSPLPDDAVLGVILSQVKKRRDSIEAYEKGGRPELADQEKLEVDILSKYLPEQMSEEEVKAYVKEAIRNAGASGPSDLGKVMGTLVPKLKGKADNALVSKIVKEELGKL